MHITGNAGCISSEYPDEYVLMPSQWVDLEKRITKEMLDDKQKKIEKLLQAEMEGNPILIKYWFNIEHWAYLYSFVLVACATITKP